MGVFFATSRFTGLTPHDFFGIAFWIGFTLTYVFAEVWLRSSRPAIANKRAGGEIALRQYPKATNLRKGSYTMRLTHIHLQVSDVDAAREFFETFFGLRCTYPGQKQTAIFKDETLTCSLLSVL